MCQFSEDILMIMNVTEMPTSVHESKINEILTASQKEML